MKNLSKLDMEPNKFKEIIMQEEWTRWTPIEGLAEKYDVDFILDGKEGLKIRLYQDGNRTHKVDLIFEGYADTYRHTNESFRIKTVHELAQKYDKEFYGNWSFFKVSDSEYLKWFSEESCEYSEEFDFTHYCILGTDSVVDIIARYEPTVEFIK